eukprot:6192316-Pleurochrysis_carterae.AAC.2
MVEARPQDLHVSYRPGSTKEALCSSFVELRVPPGTRCCACVKHDAARFLEASAERALQPPQSTPSRRASVRRRRHRIIQQKRQTTSTGPSAGITLRCHLDSVIT